MLVLPISAYAQFPFAGDESANVGTFVKAIFEHPEITISKRVVGAAEFLSAKAWTECLERALETRGKGSRIVFVEASLDEYEKLWGPMGLEIGLMFKYFEGVAKGKWKKERGSLLFAKDLGIEGQMQLSETIASKLEW